MNNGTQSGDLLASDPAVQAILEDYWYYTIELLPGVWTSGHEFPNVVLTRDTLSQIDVRGLDCLDIGTMEGLVPTLLSRRGARYVAAYDRFDFRSKIEMVQARYNVSFDYFHGMKLSELASLVKQANHHPLDLVVFSGVLYHMFDPLAGLALARGLVRNGGILVLETSAVIHDTMGMFFNANGRFYPGTNYFQISLVCLDYCLRFMRLQALDCIYQLGHVDPITGLRVCRVCIPCRAVKAPMPLPGDTWMSKPFAGDFSEFLNWEELESDAAEVPYTEPSRKFAFHNWEELESDAAEVPYIGPSRKFASHNDGRVWNFSRNFLPTLWSSVRANLSGKSQPAIVAQSEVAKKDIHDDDKIKAIDIYTTVKQNPEYPIDVERTRLRLTDRS